MSDSKKRGIINKASRDFYNAGARTVTPDEWLYPTYPPLTKGREKWSSHLLFPSFVSLS